VPSARTNAPCIGSPHAEHGEEDKLAEVTEEVEVRGPPLLGEVDPDELEWAEASEVVLLRRVLSGG
jgi:hypothetical protein